MSNGVKFTTRHMMDGKSFEMPRSISLDEWTNSYRDDGNNIFVVQRHGRKLLEVCERAAGNQTILHSRHRRLNNALSAAINVARAHYGDISLTA